MDDLISRLSELRSQYNCFDESERDAYHTLSDAIEALKAQQWISCSERLPKTNGVYIVARWFGDGCEKRILSDACYFDGSDTWYDDTRLNHGREYVTHKIVAWMPLPSPYKEDNHYKMGKMLADNFYNGVSSWREYADKRAEEICKDYTESENKE